MKMMAFAQAMVGFAVVAASVAVWAYTPAETNAMARLILLSELHGDEDDLDVQREYHCAYTNWQGFIGGDEPNGWRAEEKEAALYSYLASVSTGNCTALDGETQELLGVGLGVLRDLAQTNALPIIREWALNPQGVHRTEAIDLYYSWSRVDGNFVDFTGRMLTNAMNLTRSELRSTVWGAVGALQKSQPARLEDLQCRTNVIALLYGIRLDQVENAIPLDVLFASEMLNYKTSTNRLETISHWLTDTNCTPGMVEYFTPITNQLR